MNKKLAAIGFAAAVAAGGATGVVLNATGTAGAATTIPDTIAPDTSVTDGTTDSGTTTETGRPGHGRHGHGGRIGEGRGERFELIATTIGITTDELRTGLQGGQTIAEIAVANGSSAQAVIDALVAQATERITTFVNETPQPPQRPADDSTTDDSTTDSSATGSNLGA
jgi:hypothetical protein